jgi:hypothetical protein
MAGRVVFLANVGRRDRVTRESSDGGIKESFLTNTYRPFGDERDFRQVG